MFTILASAHMAEATTWERLGRFWFEELPERIAPLYWSCFLDALPFDSEPVGADVPPWDPQTPTGRPYSRVVIEGRPRPPISTKAYSAARIRDALRERARVIIMSLEELDVDNVPMSGADLYFELLSPDDDPNVATFFLRKNDDRPDGYATFSDEVMEKSVDALYELCLREDLDFAVAGDAYFEGALTHLEWALNRDEDDGMIEARTWLRGYSWITVTPPEIAQRLGGPEALRASGAFAYVEELPHGGLWLRATETADDYDAAAVRKVFDVVAPVLPAGQPRETWYGEEDPESWRIVQEDAANHR